MNLTPLSRGCPIYMADNVVYRFCTNFSDGTMALTSLMKASNQTFNDPYTCCNVYSAIFGNS